jgi:hypothetical protein
VNDQPSRRPRGIFSGIAHRKHWTSPDVHSGPRLPSDKITTTEEVFLVTEPKIVCPAPAKSS